MLVNAGLPVLNAQTPFRGMATFEAESYDKIAAILSDPEYRERVVPDEHKFFDAERSVWMAGGMADVVDKRAA